MAKKELTAAEFSYHIEVWTIPLCQHGRTMAKLQIACGHCNIRGLMADVQKLVEAGYSDIRIIRGDCPALEGS